MSVGLQSAVAPARPRVKRKTLTQSQLAALPRTEEEFVEWCDEDIRAEFVEGEVIIMPSPTSMRHGKISHFLDKFLGLYNDLKQLGIIIGPNIQVRLRPRVRREPDLLFIAQDRVEIIKENHIEGAPDLVIEIVSPDSVERDWYEKHMEYERAGVREYWVIDPRHERMVIYVLNDAGEYETVAPDEDDPTILRSVVLAGFWLRPEWLWQDSLPSVWDAARELGLVEK